jgi:PAS domain S-box-containing protein
VDKSMEGPDAPEHKDLFDMGAERLALALQSSDLGFWDFDLVTLKGSFTKACAEIFGLPHGAEPGQISYAEWVEAIHPEDRSKAEEATTAAQDPSGDGIYDIELRIRHPDGSVRWANAKGKTYFTSDTATEDNRQQRRAIRFIGIIRDVTRHQLQKKAIAEGEERFHRAIHEVPIPIMVTGDNGKVVELNRAWQELTGYNMTEIPTVESWSQLAWSEQDGMLLRTEIDKLRNGNEAHFPLKLLTRIKNDNLRSWLLYAAFLSNPQNEKSAILLSAVDVTERENAEAERDRLLFLEQKARAVAEDASRSKDHFIATLSHELRTPLNAIVGWTSIVRHSLTESGLVAQGLEIIERNARIQTELIADLLDLSRIVSGNARVDMTPVNLVVVLGQVVQSVRPAAVERHLALECFREEDAGDICVLGDKARIGQIFSNLLNNALKFTPAGGRIAVHIEKGNTSVSVIVSDTGQGIASSFLPHLFESYSQAEPDARSHRGLGLGLAICKHLVGLHRGDIYGASEGLGRGARFTVKLPLFLDARLGSSRVLTESPPLSVASEGIVADNRLVGVSIVAVDDNIDARLLLEIILKQSGAKVITCESGQRALETIRSVHPDVVISDILMPDMDGYEFLNELRALGTEDAGQVPVIALTAFASESDIVRIRQAGFQMHVPKPVEPAQLILAIAELLRTSNTAT